MLKKKKKGGGQRILVLRQYDCIDRGNSRLHKNQLELILKNSVRIENIKLVVLGLEGRYISMLECLPRLHEVLGLIPTTINTDCSY